MGALHIPKHAFKQPSKHSEQLMEQSYFPPISASKSQPSNPPSTADAASTTPTSVHPENPHLLQVLVAEDDPINSKIVEKRLTKLGHTVKLTGNGEACASAFAIASKAFDIVLMDIQVSIVGAMYLPAH